jgi:hypothetical protein
MALIQTLDLVVGAAYLASGAIGIAAAGFPMFNAALFASLLWFLSRPPIVSLST